MRKLPSNFEQIVLAEQSSFEDEFSTLKVDLKI